MPDVFDTRPRKTTGYTLMLPRYAYNRPFHGSPSVSPCMPSWMLKHLPAPPFSWLHASVLLSGAQYPLESGGDSGVESKLRLTGGHRSSTSFFLARSRRDGLGLLGTDQHLAANEQTSEKAFVDEVYSYVSNFSESPLGRHFVGPATS